MPEQTLLSSHPRPIMPSSAEVVQRTRSIVADLFGPPEARDFRVRYWNGLLEGPSSPDRPVHFTLVLKHPGALRRMLLPPTERALGEAYVRDDFDIEGDMEAATRLGGPLIERFSSPRELLRFALRVRELPSAEADGAHGHTRRWRWGSKHSHARDAAAIHYHYDVGNDFYKLWLDDRMVYSCGYFPSGEETIDEAQEAKLEHICRKLRLQPGERLLDIGCGWGGLVKYAAERHGVQAVGITLSEPQAELARERIAEAGLSERCTVEVRDYRDLPDDAAFDKIASVGMVEHVGGSRLPEYFAHAYRLLRPGGLFLNHGIVSLGRRPSALARRLGRPIERWGSFIERYVFPDGELVSPAEMIRPAEVAGFEVRDAESLREHYARTLRHWVSRLEAHRDEAIAMVGEPTYRIWRIYMAGSAASFAVGRTGIVQILLGKRDASGAIRLPATRADLYAA
jgi:cyclopropane-fatty-acyl-phospholipid synthase